MYTVTVNKDYRHVDPLLVLEDLETGCQKSIK